MSETRNRLELLRLQAIHALYDYWCARDEITARAVSDGHHITVDGSVPDAAYGLAVSVVDGPSDA